MCRRNQALAMGVIGFFLGLLLGCICELSFGLLLVVSGGIALGICVFRKK